MADKLSEEQVAELKQSFNEFDKDGGGTIRNPKLIKIIRKKDRYLSRNLESILDLFWVRLAVAVSLLSNWYLQFWKIDLILD